MTPASGYGSGLVSDRSTWNKSRDRRDPFHVERCPARHARTAAAAAVSGRVMPPR